MIGSHDSLQSFYQTNFNMHYFHGYSLAEIEEMMPWERDVFISLQVNQKEKEKNK